MPTIELLYFFGKFHPKNTKLALIVEIDKIYFKIKFAGMKKGVTFAARQMRKRREFLERLEGNKNGESV